MKGERQQIVGDGGYRKKWNNLEGNDQWKMTRGGDAGVNDKED